jgi:hypothetical protein
VCLLTGMEYILHPKRHRERCCTLHRSTPAESNFLNST